MLNSAQSATHDSTPSISLLSLSNDKLDG